MAPPAGGPHAIGDAVSRSRLSLGLRLVGLLALAAGASAQDDIDQRVFELLNERNREDMHPGNPLKLVGVEQEGNSFRERTPALLNGDIVAALVDPEENRARRLAMYATPERVDSALPVRSLMGSSFAPRYQAPAQVEHQPERPQQEEPSETGLVLRLACVLGALACLFAIKTRLS